MMGWLFCESSRVAIHEIALHHQRLGQHVTLSAGLVSRSASIA
jgi:hypothetical protein